MLIDFAAFCFVSPSLPLFHWNEDIFKHGMVQTTWQTYVCMNILILAYSAMDDDNFIRLLDSSVQV